MERREQYARWLEANAADQNSSDPEVRNRFLTVVDAYQKASEGPVSTVTGMTQTQARQRGEAGMSALEAATPSTPTALRIGVPLMAGAATVAAAPATLPALALASMYGAAGGIAGEALGQGAEYLLGRRNEVGGPQLTAAAYGGAATPMPMKEASRIGRFLANAGIFGIASEGEETIRKGEYTPPSLSSLDATLDAAGRVAGPAFAGFLSMKAPEVNERAIVADQRKAQVSRERFGGGWIMSDLGAAADKRFTNSERRALAGNSRKARQLLDNASANVGDAILEAFKDAPKPELLADQLRGYQGQLTRLNDDLSRAQEVYDAKLLAAEQAKATDAVYAAKLQEDASSAALDVLAKRALRAERLDQMFGTLGNDLSQVTTDARKTRLQEFASAIKSNIKNGVGRLYDSAGIRDDDIVANESDIYAWLDRADIGKAQRGAIRADIELALKGPDMKDEAGNITLGAYRMMRDKIADNMAAAGMDRRAAQRAAGNAYDAVRMASEEFLGTYRPEAAGSFKNANQVARSVYAAREGKFGAVDLIEQGDYGELVKLFEREGYKRVVPEVDAYIAAMRGIGDDASAAAANGFRTDFNRAIRDTLVGESLLRESGLLDSGLQAINVGKLVKRASAFVSDSGFPFQDLGLGSKDELNALARIASREGRSGMTMQEMSQFFDDVARVGIPGATARREYESEMTKFFLANKSSDKQAALSRAMEAQTKANLDLDEAKKLYDRASSDPLVRLFNDRSFMVNPDQSQNGNWISKLLTVGETDLGSLMRTLRDNSNAAKAALGDVEVGRRTALADDISKAVQANLLFSPLQKATGETGRVVNLTDLTNLFYGEGAGKMRAVVGDETFGNLKETWGRVARDMLQRRVNLGVSAFSSRDDFIAAAAAAGMLGGKTTGGVIAGTALDRIKNALYRGDYTLLYFMYGNPSTSKLFKEVAYDVDKFAQMSPRNAVILQVANRKDQEAERARMENEMATQGRPTR